MLAIAHRTPVNAVRCADLAAAGVSVFEVDVQTRGGELVVSHYLPVTALLPRLRRDRWSLTWRDRARTERPLAEAVAALPARAEVLLDLKTDIGPDAEALASRVVAEGPDPDRCHVSTKGWATLEVLAAGGYRTWRTIADQPALDRALGHDTLPDHAVTVRHRLLSDRVVAALHARGPRVMAWTVNAPARVAELAAMGVDGITSDSPDVLRLTAGA